MSAQFVYKSFMQFDRRKERAFRQGTVAVEARLDLHGLRRNEAQEALQRFVLRQAAAGKRTLLVITGKGVPTPPSPYELMQSGANPRGVLRAYLPRWCAEPPLCGLIHTLRPAAPKHGGEGAFYLILRRQS